MRYIALMLGVLLLAACVPITETPVNGTPIAPEQEARFTVTGIEGELIRLNPKAVDPDDDRVAYGYRTPFDKQGVWQTALGDEGEYYTIVSASDGRGGEAVETVRVIVLHKNRAPVVDCGPVIVDEGSVIDLHDWCNIADEDSPDLTVEFGGWMDSWRRETSYDDAGTHRVLVFVSDNDPVDKESLTQDILVTVRNVNRPPRFGDFPDSLEGTEGDILTLPVDGITDPDGDEITITVGRPFGDDGVWETDLGDAGTYDLDVIASDGETTVKRRVHVELALRNTPPTLARIADIAVDEGETITLPISATDREGDELAVTITGWMTSATYTTTYDDAGTYTTTVSVTDGEFTAEQVVHITVRDRNRPPYFVTPA